MPATSGRSRCSGLLAIHARLLAGTRLEEHGGRTHTSQNWIGGSDFNPCSASFVPPQHEHVEPLLDDLCAFCNEDSLPAIVQAAIAHDGPGAAAGEPRRATRGHHRQSVRPAPPGRAAPGSEAIVAGRAGLAKRSDGPMVRHFAGALSARCPAAATPLSPNTKPSPLNSGRAVPIIGAIRPLSSMDRAHGFGP